MQLILILIEGANAESIHGYKSLKPLNGLIIIRECSTNTNISTYIIARYSEIEVVFKYGNKSVRIFLTMLRYMENWLTYSDALVSSI